MTSGQLFTPTVSFVGPQPASGSRANGQVTAGGIVKPKQDELIMLIQETDENMH